MSVVLSFVTAVLWGFGNVFQKQGMTTSFPKITLKKFFSQIPTILKTLFTNWLWLIGTSMMAAGAILYVIALGLGGDVSVVQPILCLAVVVSALVGVIWLKEKVNGLEWFGIFTVFVGVVMVSVVKSSGGSAMPAVMPTVIFFSTVALLAGAAFLLGRVGISQEFSLAVSAGLAFGLANLSVATLMILFNSFEAGTPLFPVRVIGILTAFPLYGIIVFNLLGSAFYQTAFANGRASIVASVCTIIGNTVPIIGAVLILGEKISVFHAVGIIVVLAGAIVLAIGNRNQTVAQMASHSSGSIRL
ncbi:MAG TPA: hypothetical protein PKG98_11510 [Myxococcota bacterium]|nr:hypothetical protein [Myxococcota bacterium]